MNGAGMINRSIGGAPVSLARNSAVTESEGGQKFLPTPTPFLFARPSVSVLRAKRAIIRSFRQKIFELRPKNTASKKTDVLYLRPFFVLSVVFLTLFC